MRAIEGLRVLVVEDEALIALTLEDMLEELGCVVAAVAGVLDEAVAAAETVALDMAVVDANLNGRSARPVVETLRARGAPVLIASGYDAAELARLGLHAPALRKPYRLADLERALCGLRARSEPQPS